MDFLRPTTWAEALAAKADQPDAVPIQGGTDVMVEINFDRAPPGGAAGPHPGRRAGDLVGAGRAATGSGAGGAVQPDHRRARRPRCPDWRRRRGRSARRRSATAAPSAGNLGAASPAGDSHPPLLAADAVIEVESRDGGVRLIPAAEFYLGVKRNALRPGRADPGRSDVPAASGPQYFSKVGTRNAMVIAVCSFAVALHPGERRVGTGIGSAAPTPRRALEAEEFLAGELDWDAPLDPAVLRALRRTGRARPPRRSTTCAAPPATARTPSA